MATVSETTTTTPSELGVLKFPYKDEGIRLGDYDYYEKLFLGQHYEAFRVRINSDIWTKEYGKMRYVVANFAGLVSKIVADLLFIEPPKIQVKDGDQKFVDALVSENNLKTQNYESAIQNSYLGDAVYKLRVDKRTPLAKESSVIIEQITPRIYFPQIDPNNVKGTPLAQELAWIITIGAIKYLRKEIHTPGKIRNELWQVEGNANTGWEIKASAPLSLIDTELKEEEDTGIEESLIIHIPNWRPGNRHYGLSDYLDLETLFFAINNRISKVDNVLDKHTDPILAIPEGILDEDGKVKRSALGVISRGEGDSKDTDPAYITWDANLESAFKQIDKLVEFLFMMSETSPDILGMGQGQAESGRALKLKLLRTIAKTQRKQLYYTDGLKQLMYVAQLLAKKYGCKAEGIKMSGDAKKPEIVWNDGLPKDMTEMLTNEQMAIDAGITTKKDAIMRVYDVEAETADQMLKDIKDETALDLPAMNIGADGTKFAKGLNAAGAKPAMTQDMAAADKMVPGGNKPGGK